MGVGTASGGQAPDQLGVIRGERESGPVIPLGLLKLTADQLQAKIDGMHTAILADGRSSIASLDRQDKIANYMVVCQFAKTAVERRDEASQG